MSFIRSLTLSYAVFMALATNLQAELSSDRQPQPEFNVEAITNHVLNFQLYSRESWKGTKESEVAEFLDHARLVRLAQAELAKTNESANKRVFHAKSHGCLTGRLILDPDRDAKTQHGIFVLDGKQDFNVLVRFSNGVGTIESDRKPDVRGMAVKIFGANKGQGTYPTMDLLTTNSPTPFGSDQAEFIEFMNATVFPGFLHNRMLRFLASNPTTRKAIIERTTRATTMKSLVGETYWSGHPYLMGQNQAVKFFFRPIGLDSGSNASSIEMDTVAWVKKFFSQVLLSSSEANVMATELRRSALNKEIEFGVYAQFDDGTRNTPVEDASVEWNAQEYRIATLKLDRQQIGMAGNEQFSTCENLAFTPGRFHPEHRPIGNMGRGRIFTYEASARGRSASFMDPEEESLFARLRRINTPQASDFGLHPMNERVTHKATCRVTSFQDSAPRPLPNGDDRAQKTNRIEVHMNRYNTFLEMFIPGQRYQWDTLHTNFPVHDLSYTIRDADLHNPNALRELRETNAPQNWNLEIGDATFTMQFEPESATGQGSSQLRLNRERVIYQLRCIEVK